MAQTEHAPVGRTTSREIGRSRPRVEDDALLAGAGQFIDDITLPRMVHAAFVRSTRAHAVLRAVDTSVARALPGVLAVYTGVDIAAVSKPLDFGDGPLFTFEGLVLPRFPALAVDRVRFWGEPVAIVLATSRALAEDAADLIWIDYEDLPVVLDPAQALLPGAPVLHEEIGSNLIAAEGGPGMSYGDTATAFAEADLVVEETITGHRQAPMPMEVRGVIADYQRATDELTYYASIQNPHMYRVFLAEHLDHAVSRVRVVARDVGGSFGFKGSAYREDVVVAAASKLAGRPVKWIEDRVEHLTSLGSARADVARMSMAVKRDGTITGIRMHVTLDFGAYPAYPPATVFSALIRGTVLSALRTPNFDYSADLVATNKHTYISFRGPGATETTARERMMDVVAERLGMDPVEIRRINLLRLDEQPRKMATGATVADATVLETLDLALDRLDLPTFRRHQAEALAAGRYVGMGLSTSIQPAPAFPDWWQSIGFDMEPEPARARLELDGTVTLITAQMGHGQSHSTTLGQVVSDVLGVPFDVVKVRFGDTSVSPFFLFGTGASRGAAMASGAARAATAALRAEILERAAAMVSAQPGDLDVVGGRVCDVATGRPVLELRQVAHDAFHDTTTDVVAPLDQSRTFRPNNMDGGWASSTHVCVVEVDPDLGLVDVQRYICVEDCGVLINPAVVEGQVMGGIAMGIGGTLLELQEFDEAGVPLHDDFTTYLMATATELPRVEFVHLNADGGPGGAFNPRGVGEGGTVIAPAAVMNAVANALAPLGVRIATTSLSAPRLRALIADAAREVVDKNVR